ncbi:MAG TPA: hypothetical protein VHA30_03880 [Patescibacteria group bacterium]|nr:hypothetical protein [Patescibacteria group bacterium]
MNFEQSSAERQQNLIEEKAKSNLSLAIYRLSRKLAALSAKKFGSDLERQAVYNGVFAESAAEMHKIYKERKQGLKALGAADELSFEDFRKKWDRTGGIYISQAELDAMLAELDRKIAERGEGA